MFCEFCVRQQKSACVCGVCVRGRRHGMTSLRLLCVPLSFRQKNIRTYFLAHADFCSRRNRRNRRNSLAHFSCLTRNAQNSQTFTRSARFPPPHGVRRSDSPFCVFREFCVKQQNSACVCSVCVPKICSSVKIIRQKRRGALRSSLYYLLCVPI